MITNLFIYIFGGSLSVVLLIASCFAAIVLSIYRLSYYLWPWQNSAFYQLERKYQDLHKELLEDQRKLKHRVLALENKK